MSNSYHQMSNLYQREPRLTQGLSTLLCGAARDAAQIHGKPAEHEGKKKGRLSPSLFCAPRAITSPGSASALPDRRPYLCQSDLAGLQTSDDAPRTPPLISYTSDAHPRDHRCCPRAPALSRSDTH